MEHSVYSIKVANQDKLAEIVADHLGREESPERIRLATNIPLSNKGWPSGVVGCLLRLDERGALIGAEDQDEVPRLLVPWSNIAYLADGLDDGNA